jgi:hypothetical protein
MIKKESYMTREDGVELYRTFSDTDHKIRNKRTGNVYGDAVDISEAEEYEEVDEYIELEGASTYEEVLEINASISEEKERTTRKINMLNLTDNQALSVKELYPRWEDKVNSTIEMGYITLYNDKLWRARQTHTALEVYPPSLDTASLYEVIVKDHEGTMEDPIPYTPPMEIFEGKYYTQFDVLYKCTRDSGTALTHDLFDLRGIYVELIEK